MADHYKPDTMNAHIDTKPFMERLMQKLFEQGAPSSRDNTADFLAAQRADCYRTVYDAVDAVASGDPEEPNDTDLLCRYLSPEKFLWFISDKTIHLARPDTFDDYAECALHSDYHIGVQQQLPTLVEKVCGAKTRSLEETGVFWNTLQAEWHVYERSRRRDWLISCWTKIDKHEDDKLISYKYAGGRFGVGITVEYGELKRLFQEQLASLDRDGKLRAGYVSYDPRVMKPLPFNKRPGFHNECEVRFASRTPDSYVSAYLKDDSFQKLGLRLSLDAAPHHHAAVRFLWDQAGGDMDNIHES